MKTIRIIVTVFALHLMVSCQNTYYRMVTTLDRNGNAFREIYTQGDSVFMAGNMKNNPYLFDISSGWNVTRFDSILKYDFFGNEGKLNVKVSKSAPSIDLFSKELTCDQDKRPLAAPEETLTKKNRWFYTNYTFTGVYQKLSYNAPVAIDKYLSNEEQKLWTQGNFSDYEVMNGSEMNDMLTAIEDKFMNWYSRNCFELSLSIIEKLSDERFSDVDKDKFYNQLKEADITPEKVCKALDAYNKTTRYTELYKANDKKIELDFEDSLAVVNLLGQIISYELVVPGKILSTNSSIINSNHIMWKVDGVRVLFDDYILTAEYRIVNLWAFIISGLIFITAIVSTILLLKRKRNI